jgi:hypothetical protein
MKNKYAFYGMTFIMLITLTILVRWIVITNEAPLRPFSENGKWGYINKKGKTKIKPQYYMAGEFSQGWALVATNMTGEGNEAIYDWRYINSKGKFMNKQVYSQANDFVGPYAGVVDKDGKRLYYIDRKGKKVTPPVSYIDKYRKLWQQYRVFSPPKNEELYSDPIPFSTSKEPGGIGKYGYKDEKGNVVIPAKLDSALFFSEGLAGVGRGDVLYPPSMKYGYIDEKGELVIDYKYNFVDFFSEGLALVSIRKDEKDDEFFINIRTFLLFCHNLFYNGINVINFCIKFLHAFIIR